MRDRRMKNWKLTGLVLICVTLLASGANGADGPAKSAKATSGQDNWQSTLSEAKKEGKVTFYNNWPPAVRTALTPAFGKKYGINLEFTPFGRSAELVARVQTENNAGLYYADVYGVGATTLIAMMKPAGLLGPIEPMLLLPEVKETKYWRGGKFPFLDNEKLGIALVASRQGYIMYNTEQIKPGEITTFKDLLKPQYKGKITMDDPTMSGPANTLMGHLALDLWNVEETKDFLRQLVKQQGVVLQREGRLLVESVARGKYAIALAPQPDLLPDFLNAGAPIGVVKSGCVSTGLGNIGIPKRQAHPHAAKILVNWLLSQEAESLIAPNIGSPSLRTDVSTVGINPIFLFQPGEKLYMDDEEHILFRDKLKPIAKQAIEEAGK